MNGAAYLELLGQVAPETVMVLTVLAVLAADALALRELSGPYRKLLLALIGSAGCLVAAGWLAGFPADANWLEGVFVSDALARGVKIGLLALTAATLLLAVETGPAEHPGEYAALVLLAALGMLFLVSSEDLLMIFVSLELTSLCLYALAGFDKACPRSAEAGLKYFLVGGVSAAFTLYGFSLLYGVSGGLRLEEVAAALRQSGGQPVFILALALAAIGFAFKVAAVPLQFWAPDVYQGAPAPSAALIASGSKVAGFFVFARILSAGFADTAIHREMVLLLALLAGASMILGNLAALVQSSVRRLLAYSAIAHAGYLLLGILAVPRAGLAALMYYALTYALAALGAFGVVALVERHTGGSSMTDFDGLRRRSPLLSLAMLVFMLSLAGIPPLAGFFGKFYVFATVLQTSGLGGLPLALVILALALSAVSLYYYLLVLKRIYVQPASPLASKPIPLSLSGALVLVLALLVVLLGCLPELLLRPLASGAAIH